MKKRLLKYTQKNWGWSIAQLYFYIGKDILIMQFIFYSIEYT